MFCCVRGATTGASPGRTHAPAPFPECSRRIVGGSLISLRSREWAAWTGASIKSGDSIGISGAKWREKRKRTDGYPVVFCSSEVGEQQQGSFEDLGDGRYQHQPPNEQQQEHLQHHHLYQQQQERRKRVEIVTAAAVTVVLGTCNRVLYKLALVPLRHYPFFLAQLATFAYVVVYFSILHCRYHAGIITDEMLSLPKARFLLVGLFEAAAAAAGMAAGAVLSGALIPILSQTFLVWQLLLSAIFLGRRYRTNQLLGCLLVSIGVILTVVSGSGAGVLLKSAGIFWILLMVISFLFQAADTVLKEIIFLDAKRRFEGRSVDLFVVNSFGSAFQAFFICILVPFLSKLWGVPFDMLPTYIMDGTACFLNIGSLSKGCEGAPLLPILFVLVNMAFNISLLHLLKISSAVVSCLASTFSVPLSIYAFTLPLPYLATPSTLSAGFIAGAAVLVSGLLLYSWTPTTNLSTTFTK